MLRLRFEPFTATELGAGLDAIASALMDTHIELGPLPSATFVQNRRERSLSAAGVRVVELATRTWESGRDGGWGHSVRWTIEAQAPCGPVTLSFSASGWEPVPNGLGLDMQGLDLPTFRRLRARLIELLGVERDQSDQLWPALANIESALADGMEAFAGELYLAARTKTELELLHGSAQVRELAQSLE